MLFLLSSITSFTQEYLNDDVDRVKSFPERMVYYKRKCPLVNGKGWSSIYFLNKLGKVDSVRSYSYGKLIQIFRYFYNDQGLLIEQNQIYPNLTGNIQYNYYYQYDYDEKGRVKVKKMFEDSLYKRLISVKDSFRYDSKNHVISLNFSYPNSKQNKFPSKVLFGYDEFGQKIYEIWPRNGDSSIYRYSYDENGFVDSVYEELQSSIPYIVNKSSFRLSYKTDRKGNWVKCYAHLNGKTYLYIVRKLFY